MSREDEWNRYGRPEVYSYKDGDLPFIRWIQRFEFYYRQSFPNNTDEDMKAELPQHLRGEAAEMFTFNIEDNYKSLTWKEAKIKMIKIFDEANDRSLISTLVKRQMKEGESAISFIREQRIMASATSLSETHLVDITIEAFHETLRELVRSEGDLKTFEDLEKAVQKHEFLAHQITASARKSRNPQNQLREYLDTELDKIFARMKINGSSRDDTANAITAIEGFFSHDQLRDEEQNAIETDKNRYRDALEDQGDEYNDVSHSIDWQQDPQFGPDEYWQNHDWRQFRTAGITDCDQESKDHGQQQQPWSPHLGNGSRNSEQTGNDAHQYNYHAYALSCDAGNAVDDNTFSNDVIVPSSIGGYMVNVLLDSGSSINLISSELFNSVKSNRKIESVKTNITISSVNKTLINAKSKITFEMAIELNKRVKKIELEFYVITELAYPVIVGTGGMSKLDISIRWSNGKLEVKFNDVPKERRSHSMYFSPILSNFVSKARTIGKKICEFFNEDSKIKSENIDEKSNQIMIVPLFIKDEQIPSAVCEIGGDTVNLGLDTGSCINILRFVGYWNPGINRAELLEIRLPNGKLIRTIGTLFCFVGVTLHGKFQHWTMKFHLVRDFMIDGIIGLEGMAKMNVKAKFERGEIIFEYGDNEQRIKKSTVLSYLDLINERNILTSKELLKSFIEIVATIENNNEPTSLNERGTGLFKRFKRQDIVWHQGDDAATKELHVVSKYLGAYIYELHRIRDKFILRAPLTEIQIAVKNELESNGLAGDIVDRAQPSARICCTWTSIARNGNDN